MVESRRLRPRLMAFCAVLALHLALIALLLAPQNLPAVGSPVANIEILSLPRAAISKVTYTNARFQHVLADMPIPATTPVLDPKSTSSSSAAGNHGAAVNWIAEAHRAVQAFEIRANQPADNSVAGASPWNGYRAQRGEHTDEDIKTESGDWIVWINASCYRIAGWQSHNSALDAPTICPRIRPAGRSGDSSPRRQ